MNATWTKKNVNKISVGLAIVLLLSGGMINEEKDWFIVPGWTILSIYTALWFYRRREDFLVMGPWVVLLLTILPAVIVADWNRIEHVFLNPTFDNIFRLASSTPFWFFVACYSMLSGFLKQDALDKELRKIKFDKDQEVQRGIYMDIGKYRPTGVVSFYSSLPSLWNEIKINDSIYVFRPTAFGPYETLHVIAKFDDKIETDGWGPIRKEDIDRGYAYHHVENTYGPGEHYVKFGVAYRHVYSQENRL